MPILAVWLRTRGKVAVKGGISLYPQHVLGTFDEHVYDKRTGILFHFDGSNIFNSQVIIGQVLYWICDSSYRGYLTLSAPLFLSI